MRHLRAAAILAAAILVLTTAASAARSQRVSFRTDDGVTIAATWYEPSFRPAPAVILVHMLGRSRRDWDSFASRLADSGIGALAIDLRGHGDSLYFAGGEAGDYSSMVNDLTAARRYLGSRADVRHSSIGIAGASIGANLAVLAAAADTAIAGVALLSPSLDYRGLRIEAAARKYGNRPMLLVASDDDPYATRSAVELQKGGPGRELLSLTAAGHGTNMLSRSYELAPALVDWFRRTLQ
ncbi:MAG TPA: alpha/beta fold hydrolase [Vicinamibacterales bacterium]